MNLFPVDASASGPSDAQVTASVLAETILILPGWTARAGKPFAVLQAQI